MEQPDRRKRELMARLAAMMNTKMSTNKCITEWLIGVEHSKINEAITETKEEFEQPTSPNAGTVQILASRMTLRDLISLFCTLCFHLISLRVTVFVLHLMMYGVVEVAKSLCEAFRFGWTTVCFVCSALCFMWNTMWWGFSALLNIIKSAGDLENVDLTSLKSHWQSLSQPPSVETNMKHAGISSFIWNSDQTPIQTTIKANLGILQLLCYLVALILVALLMYVLYCLIEKILSKVYNGISDLFNWLAACSWVKFLQNSRANWFLEPIIWAFTRLADYCVRIVSFGWKEFSKLNIPRAVFVAVFNAIHKTWHFDTNSDNAVTKAEAMADQTKPAFKDAFRNFFCIFLQKVATKAQSPSAQLCAPERTSDASVQRCLQDHIQKIQDNQNSLPKDPESLDSVFYDDALNEKEHEKLSRALCFDIDPYVARLVRFLRSENTITNCRKKGLRCFFRQFTTTKCEHVRAGAKRIIYYQFCALFVLIVLLLFFGSIGFNHSQVSTQDIFNNSQVTTDLKLFHDREMFLQTDKRQCFRNQPVFKECMPRDLLGAYKLAYDGTIRHFREMDNATRTRCIEAHQAREADKSYFWPTILSVFLEYEVPHDSTPIEHQCPDLKEKDADLEKEEGFEHELKGRFYKHSWVPNFTSFHSRFCLINVSYDSANVNKAYNSSIADALLTPDNGVLTWLILAQDVHTSIQYRALFSAALNLVFGPLFLSLIFMKPILWAMKLYFNNSL